MAQGVQLPPAVVVGKLLVPTLSKKAVFAVVSICRVDLGASTDCPQELPRLRFVLPGAQD